MPSEQEQKWKATTMNAMEVMTVRLGETSVEKHKLKCVQTIHLPMTTLDQLCPLPLPKRSAESFRTRSST
jgi:hypothetical protein